MIKRFIIRILFHFFRFCLKLLDGRFSRLYMFFYNNLLQAMGVKMTGKPRYISTTVRFDDFNKVSLGERVVISEKVILLTHDYSVTTGLISINKCPNTDLAFIKEIIVKNNVFIGMGALILPGAIINDNVIIGAGSVIRGEVPEDSIVLGNPGKVVSSLKQKAFNWEKQLDFLNVRKD